MSDSTTPDVTVQILREIRGELRELQGLKGELRELRAELKGEIQHTNERLDRVVQEQVRLATAFVEMQAIERESLDVLGALVREVRQLGQRLDNVLVGPMGQLVRNHEERLSRVERKLDLSPLPAPAR